MRRPCVIELGSCSLLLLGRSGGDQEADSSAACEAASVSGLSVGGVSSSAAASHAPQLQLVGMLSENRELLERLTGMHARHKAERAKLAQRELDLRARDAELERLRASLAGGETRGQGTGG